MALVSDKYVDVDIIKFKHKVHDDDVTTDHVVGVKILTSGTRKMSILEE